MLPSVLRALQGNNMKYLRTKEVAQQMNFERNVGDIMNVIRHRLSWDKYPEGGKTVNFHEPMKFGEEPLTEIKRIDNTEI